MNSFDKTRVVAGIIALICFAITYVILSVIMIEASKAAPEPREPEIYYGPEIPKCDKELWLRIKDGCHG
jgi:hypothetical protein